MFSRKFTRFMSAVLTACMLFGSPLLVSQAEAFPGIKTLAAGTVAGGVVAASVGALIGAVGIGSAAIGLPALAMIGAFLGGLTTFMAGNQNSAAPGAGIGMGAAVAGGGAAILGIGGAIFTPWLLLGAAAIGGGALLWKYATRKRRYGGPGDTRWEGSFSDPFFSPNRRVANRSGTGLYGENRSVLDRVRSVFDRNRRDDGTYWNSRTVEPDGSLRSRTDFFGRMGSFFNGTSDTGTYGGNSTFFGPGYGNAGYFTPGALPGTDRVGRITVGAGTGRTSFRASANSRSSFSGAFAPTGSDLDVAQQTKDEAYQALVKTLDHGAGGTSVDAALASYRKAAANLETLRKSPSN